MKRLNNSDDFFDDLCKLYYEKIFKYIYFNIRDKSSANDIIQEVFMIAYEKLDIIAKHPNLGGFLFQTAKNIIKKYEREAYNKFKQEMECDEEYLKQIKSNKYDISFVLDSNIDESNFIYDVISSLSEEKRELYCLYYVQHKSMLEIAELMKIEYSALRMRFVRLRREIIEIVKKISDEKFYI